MKAKYIDIHAHLNFEDFDSDREEVLERIKSEEMLVINIGTDLKTSQEVLYLAKENENMYAVIGLHPTDKSDFDLESFKELASQDKVVGIGECGLDFFRIDSEMSPEEIETEKNRQEKNFRDQIELAIENNLPLMIHCRNAYPETLKILKEYKERFGEKLRGNFHFFAGSKADIIEILDLGLYFSFTGVITFAKEYEELVKEIPLSRIMSETDCPYVAPVPYRGKRNEPVFVKEVVKKLAEIKGLTEEEMAGILLENASVLFGIDIA